MFGSIARLLVGVPLLPPGFAVPVTGPGTDGSPESLVVGHIALSEFPPLTGPTLSNCVFFTRFLSCLNHFHSNIVNLS